ncbi:MAG: glycosyltransferase [Candidatus Eremiobacteraeota bacterium]|nr:glycosyltransferase [Candidatus Eremiobacteraeota bacterium]MBC5826516.1 glycosyltransferase [Candidatus Eremiobacteraeota bacterium]
MNVALVHDYLTQFGGAERALLEIHRLYPGAPVYTSLYDARRCGAAFESVDVRTTWLQKVPFATRNFRALLPFYPAAFESLDLSRYDLVISSTTSFAKGVRVSPTALHVSYVNTPTRFLWLQDEHTASSIPAAARPLFRAAVPALRRWDLAAARRPDRIISNSLNVAERVRRIYGRASDVLAPPVDVAQFSPWPETGDYYLVVARLLRYKRIELAIEACNALGVPLVIVGTGPDERKLRSLAGPTIRFAGQVDDDARRMLFARARAVIVPGVEDFGLVPVEAAAAGRPAIAFAAGGALETVIEGTTGTFFRTPTAQALAATMVQSEHLAFDARRLVAHASGFSPERFRVRLAALIGRYQEELSGQTPAGLRSAGRPAVSYA